MAWLSRCFWGLESAGGIAAGGLRSSAAGGDRGHPGEELAGPGLLLQAGIAHLFAGPVSLFCYTGLSALSPSGDCCIVVSYFWSRTLSFVKDTYLKINEFNLGSLQLPISKNSSLQTLAGTKQAKPSFFFFGKFLLFLL